MTTPFLAFILLATGVLLIVAELLLPTHGALGLAGLACLIAAIGTCFVINQYLGVAVFLGAALGSPFISAAVMHVWPQTPIGRKLVLPPVAPMPEAPQVYIGQSGTAVSQLRPMGHCEFADLRIEAQSEHGIIEPGESVKVVAIVNGRPTVRPSAQAGPEAGGNALRAGSDSMSQPT